MSNNCLPNYDITYFINNELYKLDTTERIVFGEVLKDSIKCVNAIRDTNEYSSKENIEKENKLILELIGGV